LGIGILVLGYHHSCSVTLGIFLDSFFFLEGFFWPGKFKLQYWVRKDWILGFGRHQEDTLLAMACIFSAFIFVFLFLFVCSSIYLSISMWFSNMEKRLSGKQATFVTEAGWVG
jgi:hypothetical protein